MDYMGLRGFLRDILSFYLGYKVIGMWVFHSAITSNVGYAAVALILITLWFLLEKFGIM